MAHTVSLNDGITTIDLAQDTDVGYHFVTFRTPRLHRDLAAPNGLTDAVTEIILMIVGSSANDLDDKVQDLVVMLEQAHDWAADRIGHPVRLLFKRQGVTNTSYRVITGVPLMPEPIDPDEINWIDGSVIMNEIIVSFTVLLEPVAHADTPVSIISTTLTVDPGADRIASAIAPVGDMPGPIMVSLENTGSGTTWASVWLALLEGNPINQDWANIADATASDGRQDFSITTSVTTLYSVAYVPTSELPLRSVFRCKVSAGVETDLELRFIITIGSNTYAGEWVTFTNTIGNWTLMDLGALRLPRDFFKRASQADTSPATVAVQARSKDGTVTLGADYAQLLTVRSFVRLDALVPFQSVLKYDALLRDTTVAGSFYWPARSPQTYVVNSGAELTQEAKRSGVLGMVTPGITTRIWFSASSATAHLWGATAAVVVHYLPSFSLGLRGGV